jgi:hypothetical protein
MSCSSGCSICGNTTSCTEFKCSAGYFYNNDCSSTCPNGTYNLDSMHSC